MQTAAQDFVPQLLEDTVNLHMLASEGFCRRLLRCCSFVGRPTLVGVILGRYIARLGFKGHSRFVHAKRPDGVVWVVVIASQCLGFSVESKQLCWGLRGALLCEGCDLGRSRCSLSSGRTDEV